MQAFMGVFSCAIRLSGMQRRNSDLHVHLNPDLSGYSFRRYVSEQNCAAPCFGRKEADFAARDTEGERITGRQRSWDPGGPTMGRAKNKWAKRQARKAKAAAREVRRKCAHLPRYLVNLAQSCALSPMGFMLHGTVITEPHCPALLRAAEELHLTSVRLAEEGALLVSLADLATLAQWETAARPAFLAPHQHVEAMLAWQKCLPHRSAHQ